MSEQAGETSKPEFRMQKMYIKDLSFENPNSPDVFFETVENQVELNMKLSNKKVNDDFWEVTITVEAKVGGKGEEGKTMFIVELEHAGLFLMKNIPEEHLQMMLGVECPTLLFPFTRQIVSTLTTDGGFMPFQMEPVNFMALFQNAQKQQQPQA